MKAMINIGLAIGVVCAAWQLVMIFGGWLTRPETFNFFYLVILIQIAILVLGMRRTAATYGFGGQLLVGSGASFIAGIFLFLYSLVVTTVAFPNLMNEMKVVQTRMLESAGQTPEQIAAAMAFQTPVFQALMGFMGTLITGILASLLIAVFLRKKS